MRTAAILSFSILFVFTNSFSQNITNVFGGGNVDISQKEECISSIQRATIKNSIRENIVTLKEQKINLLKSSTTVSFDWPLRMINNQQFKNYYSITNFVDHNPTATGSQFGASNLDYNCGNRTYDNIDGYNHKGIDISLWPFKWYMVSNNVVEVIAAEAGTIIDIDDGNSHSNCFCNGIWNAVYIMHADGSQAWYGHMKNNSLTQKTMGQTVAKGEYLGVVASSGCSTGPHLHFEVYDSSGNLIDPYSGPCNSMNSTSWWASQQSYYEPTLNALLTHPGVPSLGCNSTEVTKFSNCFNPGQTIYTAFYYRDQRSGDVTNMRLRRPDNSIWNSWSHTSPNSYRTSWWYWSRSLPLSGPFGTWTLEADYKGETSRYEFSYSNNSCSCPLSWSSSNGNNLSGSQSSSVDFESFGMIESNQVIQGTPSVTYDSGTLICLQNGFEVKNTAQFQVYIDGCGNR